MKINKITLGNMERCYSCTHLNVDGINKIFFASEAIGGSCYAYYGENFENKEVVWENAGGTMSIVGIPNTNGQFLATQKFFPGFKAEESKIVWGKYENDTWIIKDFISIPYLHRFDLFESNGKIHFIACILCGSKKDREDWSNKGKIQVGVLPDDLNQSMELTEIKDNLLKNHGYFRANYKGFKSAYITCETGIYVFTPPNEGCLQWQINHIIDVPVSDVAVCDLDQDGIEEIATIEPFHGDSFKIYKNQDEKWTNVYEYPFEISFAHAIWGGDLLGVPSFICGIRRSEQEIFYVQYNKTTNKYEQFIIEKGVGPANVDVLHLPNKDIIISANHTKNEAAIYVLTQ